jgi:hypothetical protein
VTLLSAMLAMTLLVYVGALGVQPAFWFSSTTVKMSRGIEIAVMAATIVLAIAVADEAVERGAPRALAYAVAVTGGALVGSILGWDVREAIGVHYPKQAAYWVNVPSSRHLHRLDVATIGTLVGGLAAFVHVNRRTALTARKRQHEAERARARAQRRTLESQLQALQARVEPMFLFGTLARIRDLYRSDAAAASAMLEDLIVYLRAALPHLRESTSTVGQETALARSWLDIIGRSHGWQIDVDTSAAARDAPLPALVVLPLVQCAVGDLAHPGLRLAVTMRDLDGSLRIDVRTSTRAFAEGIATQPLLVQIDERLRALYGSAARLEARAALEGSEARIELPLERGSRKIPGDTP